MQNGSRFILCWGGENWPGPYAPEAGVMMVPFVYWRGCQRLMDIRSHHVCWTLVVRQTLQTLFSCWLRSGLSVDRLKPAHELPDDDVQLSRTAGGRPASCVSTVTALEWRPGVTSHQRKDQGSQAAACTGKGDELLFIEGGAAVPVIHGLCEVRYAFPFLASLFYLDNILVASATVEEPLLHLLFDCLTEHGLIVNVPCPRAGTAVVTPVNLWTVAKSKAATTWTFFVTSAVVPRRWNWASTCWN